MSPTPRRFRRLKETLDRRQPDLTVVMDQVNKGHNFSAVLRSCDAVGVLEAHAIPPSRGRFELFNQTSGGTARWVEVVVHPSVEAAVKALRGRGFQVVAAHLSESARDFRSVDYTRPTAILVGAELHGVSPEALARVDHEVIIPMQGMVQSLNVSVATALILFEAMRQREGAGMYRASRLDPIRYRHTLFRWAHPRLAAWYDARGLPYPDLDDEGEPTEPLPREAPPPGAGESPHPGSSRAPSGLGAGGNPGPRHAPSPAGPLPPSKSPPFRD